MCPARCTIREFYIKPFPLQALDGNRVSLIDPLDGFSRIFPTIALTVSDRGYLEKPGEGSNKKNAVRKIVMDRMAESLEKKVV